MTSTEERRVMTLVTISTEKPISFTFPMNPSDDDVLTTLGDAILNKMEIHGKPIDSYIKIERFPIKDEETRELGSRVPRETLPTI